MHLDKTHELFILSFIQILSDFLRMKRMTFRLLSHLITKKSIYDYAQLSYIQFQEFIIHHTKKKT